MVVLHSSVVIVPLASYISVPLLLVLLCGSPSLISYNSSTGILYQCASSPCPTLVVLHSSVIIVPLASYISVPLLLVLLCGSPSLISYNSSTGILYQCASSPCPTLVVLHSSVIIVPLASYISVPLLLVLLCGSPSFISCNSSTGILYQCASSPCGNPSLISYNSSTGILYQCASSPCPTVW